MLLIALAFMALLLLQISPSQFYYYHLPTTWQTLPVFWFFVILEMYILVGNFGTVITNGAVILKYICSLPVWFHVLE